MNSFRKLQDGNWGVQCDVRQEPGTTVTVMLRNGGQKQVRLGDFQGSNDYGSFLYATAAPARPAAEQVGNLSGVLALFERARAHLRFPAIVLAVPGANITLRLSVAGPRARVPGSVTVVDAEKAFDGSRDWFGRITVDGAYQPSNAANGRTDAIVARLREFACEPARVAADHGRLTGRCCFCNHSLGHGEDRRSVAVGYGPDCAEHFGLPWGVS